MAKVIKIFGSKERISQKVSKVEKTSSGDIKIINEDGSFMTGQSVIAVLLYEILNELRMRPIAKK